MKLYLTGAISNNPAYKQDFERAWKRLNDAGYAVVSPVIFCNEKMNWDQRLRRRIQVLSTCRNIAVIATEYQSPSTCLELDIASVLSMQVKTVDEWVETAQA
ncbi:MAG: DUF4406 domain-containing protein [Treponema sp.]